MAIQLVTLHCFLTLTCSLTHHDKLVYNLSLPPSLFCYGCPLNWHTSLSLLSLFLFLSHEACNPSLSSSLCYPSSPTHLPCLSLLQNPPLKRAVCQAKLEEGWMVVPRCAAEFSYNGIILILIIIIINNVATLRVCRTPQNFVPYELDFRLIIQRSQFGFKVSDKW